MSKGDSYFNGYVDAIKKRRNKVTGEFYCNVLERTLNKNIEYCQGYMDAVRKKRYNFIKPGKSYEKIKEILKEIEPKEKKLPENDSLKFSNVVVNVELIEREILSEIREFKVIKGLKIIFSDGREKEIWL